MKLKIEGNYQIFVPLNLPFTNPNPMDLFLLPMSLRTLFLSDTIPTISPHRIESPLMVELHYALSNFRSSWQHRPKLRVIHFIASF